MIARYRHGSLLCLHLALGGDNDKRFTILDMQSRTDLRTPNLCYVQKEMTRSPNPIDSKYAVVEEQLH